MMLKCRALILFSRVTIIYVTQTHVFVPSYSKGPDVTLEAFSAALHAFSTIHPCPPSDVVLAMPCDTWQEELAANDLASRLDHRSPL